MDLVDYDQAIYDEIREEFTAFAAKLEITDLGFVPISALAGDNVVDRSANMPWFDGQPLLGHLEDVHIASDRNLVDNRFPVQYVIRPQSAEHRDYRGYAGSVVGGIFKQGDEVMVLPSRKTSKIAAIDTPDGAGRPGLPADGGDAAARGRDRHLPRRHDLPPDQPADREPPLRGDDLLVRRDLARCAPALRTSSSTRPAGSPPRSRSCATGSTSTPCTATSRRRRSRSTRSAGSRSTPPRRSSSTSTGSTAPPAASSSSTRRPT